MNDENCWRKAGLYTIRRCERPLEAQRSTEWVCHASVTLMCGEQAKDSVTSRRSCCDYICRHRELGGPRCSLASDSDSEVLNVAHKYHEMNSVQHCAGSFAMTSERTRINGRDPFDERQARDAIVLHAVGTMSVSKMYR